MHEYLVNLDPVKRVWGIIQATHLPGLEEKKKEISINCRVLLEKAFRAPRPIEDELKAVRQDSELPANELLRQSSEVVADVLTFVRLVCEFYDAVASIRPLTELEKAAGASTSALLSSIKEIAVPKA